MDTVDGLLVPYIKNVESKSVFEIAQDLLRLKELGMKGKLGVEDLTGGFFTLTNIGTVSFDFFVFMKIKVDQTLTTTKS